MSEGLLIEPHEKYNPDIEDNSGIRIGFASIDETEIKRGVEILTNVINKI